MHLRDYVLSNLPDGEWGKQGIHFCLVGKIFKQRGKIRMKLSSYEYVRKAYNTPPRTGDLLHIVVQKELDGAFVEG